METGGRELYWALRKFQANPPKIVKDAENPHYRSRYATLSNIMGAVMPELNKYGLIVVQHTSNEDANPGVVSVETNIIHVETGQSIGSMLSAATSGEAQKIGSALTYLRRYGLSAILGLVTEDDNDGNGTAAKPAPKTGQVHKGPEPEPDRKKDLQRKILDICMTIAGGDDQQAPGILAELTTWTGDDGEVKRKGITRGQDLLKMSEPALQTVYGKAKKALADWESAHGKDAPSADYDETQEDISF